MIKRIIWTAALVLLVSAGAEASGLKTTFSEVTLQGLETGKTYGTKEAAGLPLIIENTGAEPVDLSIEPLIPAAEELKEGYEPIPDISWIVLDKKGFTAVAPGGKAETDVMIVIPDDAGYHGKKYQVYIWTHSVGLSVGVGLKSRLLFSIT